MKPREPRRNVLIQARMRVGASWSDAAILNLSSKGLLLHAPDTPPRGTYVEVRRGQHVIIARVIWTSGERAGLCAQDRLPVDALIRRQDEATPSRGEGPGITERRAEPQSATRHDRSRTLARTLEFAWVALLGGFAATLIYGTVDEALAKPLAKVSDALRD